MIIQTQNLQFGFKKDQPIIKDLNLNVEKGSIYGFLGPNGAGKTTTMRLILGLLPNPENNIRIFGKTLSDNRLDIFSRIGSMIEIPSLYEHLTGWDNLEITRRIKGVSKKRIDETLELVKLTHAAHKKVKAYSLGMKQRIGLAVALLSEPELLILDEPTNGLDPNGMIETRELLIRLNKEAGTTIFLSSHLLSEVEKMATHVGIIHKGSMLFQGTIQELGTLKSRQAMLCFDTSNNLKALELLNPHFQVTLNGNGLKTSFQDREQAAHINRLLVQNEIDVYQLAVMDNDLEKLFLQITEESAV
ncbi:ABC transporter ATP-binding protein [Xanthocytophaga flava]|uniref:ABC transporter ATP-binding protein n=1 Tax=Xanthocytophaga flava TaxID=3048013 RepID=UPI0028D650A0|nr:ABC transporter ATP-binding protein [Xanthocytophaga flavus]MDJ1469881.1 ABC transporter ATP-binding protein [Xanthocytophaga flavus]